MPVSRANEIRERYDVEHGKVEVLDAVYTDLDVRRASSPRDARRLKVHRHAKPSLALESCHDVS